MAFKFELGQVVQTRTIAEECKNDKEFEKQVIQAFSDYTNCNWGQTCKEDQELNDNAIKNNNDRIVAKYETKKGDIFIITELDRTYTTILFANEY